MEVFFKSFFPSGVHYLFELPVEVTSSSSVRKNTFKNDLNYVYGHIKNYNLFIFPN